MSTQLRQRAEKAFGFLCLALPFGALALMVLIQVREGIDMPYLDDWRDYAASTDGTYSPSYLFQPANDTLYPVGKLLDSIFLDALDGNTLIYQAASMTLVLGAILMLALRLLRMTLADPFLVACAFVPTLLVLQTDSYWGRQYIAYHQAIPLVCLLAVLATIVTTAWRPTIRVAAIFALGLTAGGAYISGAFASLGAATALIAVGLLRRHRRDLLHAGLALGLASAICSAAQAYVIIVIQHGKTHHPDATWATPLSLDFWIFALGKVGRSLALPLQNPTLSLTVAASLAIATAALAFGMLWRLATANQIDRTSEDRSVVTICIAAALAVYLVLVTAGRAHLRPPGMDAPFEVFEIGFSRFHFFWIAAIWPWAFAAALVAMRRLATTHFPWLAAMASAGIALAILASGALNYRFAFAQAASVKQRGIACLQDKLINSEALLCPELYPVALNGPYAAAVQVGASIAHAVPPTLRRYNQTPKAQLLGADQFAPGRFKIQGANDVTWHGASVTLSAAADVRLEFRVYRRRFMSACRMLNVAVNLKGEPDQIAQLFYKEPNDDAFAQRLSQRLISDGVNDINFTMSSREGFSDLLRLDLLGRPGEITLSRLTVHCLLP